MQSSAEALATKLLQFVDEERNVTDMAGATEVISALEKAVVTKEILETTRLGLLINQIRKQSQDPQLSKRCKNLIRDWQLVASAGTSTGSSGPSSASASPAPRLLTPRAPAAVSPAAKLLQQNGPIRGALTPTAITRAVEEMVTPKQVQRLISPLATTTMSAQRVSSPDAPPQALRLRIKVGGPSPMVTFVSAASTSTTSAPLAVATNGGTVEPLVDRKRKYSPEECEEMATALHPSASAPALFKPNGIHPASPATQLKSTLQAAVVASASPKAEVQRPPRPPSTGNKKATSRPGSEPDVLADINIYAPLGRPPKLKSTMQLVAEMEMAKAETTRVQTPPQPAKTVPSPQPMGDASSSAQSSPSLVDGRAKRAASRSSGEVRSRAATPFLVVVPPTVAGGADDELSLVKSEMVQRFLSTSISPSALTPPSSVQSVHNAVSAPPTPSAAVETTAGVAPVRTTTVVGPSGRTRKVADWYACLKPLELSVLDELTLSDATPSTKASSDNDYCGLKFAQLQQESREVAGASPSHENVEKALSDDWVGVSGCAVGCSPPPRDDTSGAERPFTRWRERFVQTVVPERDDARREVLALPYVDIGIPYLVEFDAPSAVPVSDAASTTTEQREWVQGSNFYFERCLDRSTEK